MYHHRSAFSIDTQLAYLDYRVESPHLHYSRLALSPLALGQANVIATAIRQALLSELRCTCITRARFPGAVHEYSTLPGVREPIHDILSNLREIVLQSDTAKAQTGYLCFHGPGEVTAACLELPSSIQVVDKTQHIAQVESGSEFKIELTVERPERTARSYTQHERQVQDSASSFVIEARSTPVKSVSYHIYSIGGGPRLQELIMFEIWTDGSMTLEQMFHDAACYWTSLLQPLLGLTKRSQERSHTGQPSHPAIVSTSIHGLHRT